MQEMVDDARTRIRGLTVEELRSELDAGADIQLIDIRDVRERWKQGEIPGARSMPRGMLEFWADPSSPYYRRSLIPTRRTVVYCAGGLRSSLAADVLQDLGYTDVAHLEVGFDGWREAGGATQPVPVPEDLGPLA
ncbi:MAG: rhodanese-like domain-containing protein [Candidatus Dormibacteraceae bacterium]